MKLKIFGAIALTVTFILLIFDVFDIFACSSCRSGMDFGIDADITIIGPYEYAPLTYTEECPYGAASLWKKGKHMSKDFIDHVECIQYDEKENTWITWKVAPNGAKYKKWYPVKYDPKKVDVCNDEGRIFIKKKKVMIYKAFDNLGDPVGCF